MEASFNLALAAEAPVYLRIGKADLGSVHTFVPQLRWGELCQIREGQGGLGWIATGSMVHAAAEVAGRWANSAVWSAPVIKPLHPRSLVAVGRTHKVLIVLEEHSVIGGLGGMVAETLSSEAPTWVCRIGIQDRFSSHCGSYAYLMREHQLDSTGVIARVTHFLSGIPKEHWQGLPDLSSCRAAAA
jgi:transketolase